jgi:hypothetical protein
MCLARTDSEARERRGIDVGQDEPGDSGPLEETHMGRATPSRHGRVTVVHCDVYVAMPGGAVSHRVFSLSHRRERLHVEPTDAEQMMHVPGDDFIFAVPGNYEWIAAADRV